MAKTKKLYISDLEMCYEDAPELTFDFKGVTITYRTYLSVKGKLDFIKDVLNACMTVEGIFYPSLFDYGVRRAVIENYTNVTIPESDKKANNLCYGSGLFEEVVDRIYKDEYLSLIKATKEEIHELTHPDPMAKLVNIVDSIFNLIDTSFEKVDIDKFYSVLETVKKIDDQRSMVERAKEVYIKE